VREALLGAGHISSERFTCAFLVGNCLWPLLSRRSVCAESTTAKRQRAASRPSPGTLLERLDATPLHQVASTEVGNANAWTAEESTR